MENLKYYLDYYFDSKFVSQRNFFHESMLTNYGEESGSVAVNKIEFERLCTIEGIIKINDSTLIYNGLIIFVTESNFSGAFNTLSIPTESIAKIVAYFKKVTFDNEYLVKFKAEADLIIIELIKKLKLRVFENKKKELRDQIHNINGQINRSKEQLTNYFNQLRIAQATSYDGYLEKASANLDKELDLIQKHKKVESIIVEGDRFVINTIHLYITEPTSGRRFSLGKMSIKMPVTTGINVIFKNNTTQRRGYWDESQHPHVASDGNPCLGNIEMGVVNYITEEQYYGLFLLLLNYLECVDVADSAGSKILAWDEVNEANEVIVEGIPRKSWGGKTSNDDIGNHFGTIPTLRRADTEILDDGDVRCRDCQEVFYENDMYSCDNCGEHICESCVNHVDGDVLCSDCYNELDEQRQEYNEQEHNEPEVDEPF